MNVKCTGCGKETKFFSSSCHHVKFWQSYCEECWAKECEKD